MSKNKEIENKQSDGFVSSVVNDDNVTAMRRLEALLKRKVANRISNVLNK